MCEQCRSPEPPEVGPPPPMPTWHGFGTDSRDKYHAFLEKTLAEKAEEAPRRLETSLSLRNSDLFSEQSELRSLRACKAEAETSVADMRQWVDHPPTDDELLQELEQLSSMPTVLGTRADVQGRLFVQFRVTTEEDGTSFDLGDYELGFVRSQNGSSYRLHLIRTPGGLRPTEVLGYDLAYDGPSYTGWLSIPGFHLHTGKLVELVQLVHETIVQKVKICRYSLRGLELTSDSLREQVWEGSVTNLLKAYKRSLERLYGPTPARALLEAESKVRQYEGSIQDKLRRIRNLQTQVRSLRAELEKAHKIAAEGVEINPEQAQRDLDYLSSLPGVMGIRFDADGIPIIHVRSSYILDNEFGKRRYDLGDAEIAFTTRGRNDSASVVKIRSTRQALSSLYLSNPGTGSDWFCFGARRTTLSGLFERGEYCQFLHLAINCMNSVNASSRSHGLLKQCYACIPMNAVWQARKRRLRPRRQLRIRQKVTV